MTENKRQTGSFYEDKAAEYLESIGYDILCRNFYGKGGEIDIVAKDNETLVFVEVKYRSSVRSGFPEEAVDYRKQYRIRKTAMLYIARNGKSFDCPIRFDVISILGTKITHIKDAF